VAIDSSGMLQSTAGEKVSAVGDSFVVHMDRESLGDFDMGLYDVTVTISAYEQDREIAWKVLGRCVPRSATSTATASSGRSGGLWSGRTYCDWSDIAPEWRDADIFPVISEGALKATLGILDRTVRRGYPDGE